MAFFKRELFKREFGPIERFENALKEKLAARQKLAERLSVAESELAEKRTAAERLAVAGAANARLDRAEAAMRAVEDRTKAMRAELLEFDEQVASAERALADAKAQRDRDTMADQIEAMAAAIERAAPGFDTGATVAGRGCHQRPRCRYRKQPGFRATWMPCAARFSRRQT